MLNICQCVVLQDNPVKLKYVLKQNVVVIVLTFDPSTLSKLTKQLCSNDNKSNVTLLSCHCAPFHFSVLFHHMAVKRQEIPTRLYYCPLSEHQV